MFAIETILYPTDFSECSAYAFEFACSLAKHHGAHLIVLHVAVPLPPAAYGSELLPPTPQERDYEQLWGELRRLQPSDPTVPVEHRLENGDAAIQILRVAQEAGADLIVMGTHGRTGLGRLLLGSVAEQVLRKALCPVVTVKAPRAGARTREPLEQASKASR